MLTKLKLAFAVAAAFAAVGVQWTYRDKPTIKIMIDMQANAMGVPKGVALRVAQTESSFNPNTTGAAGEIGLFQLKCETARLVGFKGKCEQLYDPATNIRYGVEHLRRAMVRGHKVHAKTCEWVSLHNMGLGAKPQCTDYGRRVLTAQL
jgi:soluble lytic murein transglycosylase-like protein